MTPSEIENVPNTASVIDTATGVETVEFTVQTQLFDLDTVDYVTVERKAKYPAIVSDADFVARVPDLTLRLELYKIAFEIVQRREIKKSTDLDPHSWIVKGTDKNFAGTAAPDKAFNQTVNGLMQPSLRDDMTAEEKAALRASVIDDIKNSPRVIAKLKAQLLAK